MSSDAPSAPEPGLVCATLRDLLDPEVGINVIDLGMIGGVDVAAEGRVVVELMPTTPGCPMHDALAEGVRELVGRLAGVTAVEVNLVFDPPWTPDRISPEARVQLGMG